MSTLKKSSRAGALRFIPAVEGMEDRVVPAGDVTAAVRGGLLRIDGDAAANQIIVIGTGERSVVVVPLDTSTTINGQAGPHRFDGLKRGFEIRLNGGDDILTLQGAVGQSAFLVDGGDGSDQISIQGSSARKGAAIATGPGDDAIEFIGSSFNRDFFLDTGAGDDQVTIHDSRFKKRPLMFGSEGSDILGTNAGNQFREGSSIDSFENDFASRRPSVANDTASVSVSGSVTIPVTANDSGSVDPTTLAITKQPTLGTATANRDGTISYNGTTAGTDTIGYTVKSKGGVTSKEATVTVTVKAADPTDTTAPTASLTTTASEPTSATPIPFTVVFSEAVTNFVASGITATNGTVGSFTQVSSTNYTFNVTPTGQGTVTAQVSAGAARDAAGNASVASASVSRTFNTTAPTVTANALTTNDATPTLTGTVNDSTATVVVTVGTQTEKAIVSGSTWTVTLPTALAEGTYTIQVAATSTTGNTGNASLADGLIVDLTAPAPVISSTASEPTGTSPIPVTVTFSESVNDFTSADIALSNGTLSNFSAVTRTSYTFDVTPKDSGAVVVNIATGAATDAAGNPSQAATAFTRTYTPAITDSPTVTANPLTTNNSTPTLTGTVSLNATRVSVTVAGQTIEATVNGTNWSALVPTALADGTYTVQVTATSSTGKTGTATLADGLLIDTRKPLSTLTTSVQGSTNQTSVPFTLTFDEDVSNFDASKITVSNGSISNVMTTSVRVYTFTVTPVANTSVTVIAADNTARDAAGNASAQVKFVFNSDTLAPVAALTTTATNPTNANPIPFRVSFGETVSGFSAAGLSATNGTIGDFTDLTGGSYAFTVTPAGDGEVVVIVNDSAARDDAGNTSARVSRTVTYDGTAPQASLTAGVPSPTRTNPIPFTVTFNDTVVGFTNADLVVTNGTASTLATTDGFVYTFSVTPTADGDVTVAFAPGAATDAVGNPTNAQTKTVAFDSADPIATITSSLTTPTNTNPIPFTIAFSEPVIDFNASDLVVANGIPSALTANPDGLSYSLTVTPSGDGAVILGIASGAATDRAGNPSTAASKTVVFDSTPPTVIAATPTGNPTNNAAITTTFTFDERVVGLTESDVVLTNATLTSAVLSTDGLTFTVIVNGLLDGAVVVALAANAGMDVAGNPTPAISQTITYDTTPPAVTIDATSVGAIRGTATDATTGVADIAVSIYNGTAYWNGVSFGSDTELFLATTTTDDFATWSYNIPPGTYTVNVQQTDLVGNVGHTSAIVIVT